MNSSTLRSLLLKGRTYSFKHNFSTDSDVIKIPKRINRGPVDILKALASTHKRDTGAPHYKYHDDPYLIPYSNANKRSYALSLEAGRKAAHWIRQEHADLFNHKVADPQIDIFFPSKIYTENTEVNLDDLKNTIKNFYVSDSITVYNSLMKQGIEIDGETKQSLLELLCFYNCEDGINEEWLEERWFRATNTKKDIPKNVWKDNGLAEQVFHSIKPTTPEAYSAIISGMAKYGQVEGAMKIYEEACSNNIPLSVTVYNYLLSKVSSYKENHDLMWNLVKELLEHMKSKNVSPNLGTFNAVLETLSEMAINRNAKKYALQVLSEMKQVNIEPSLATFYHLMNIYYKGLNNSGILHDIIKALEGKKLQVRDPNDSMFFVTAMEMCRHKLHLVSLGYQIDDLLHYEDNYKLIGDSFRESQYYRFFFTLLCEGEPLDKFMEIYDQLVPNLYTPEPSVMLEVLNAVEISQGYKYIPRLWTDISLFDLSERPNILIKMLELINQTEDDKLNKQFVNIGWNIWEKLENQTRTRNVVQWTGSMLSYLLTLLVKNKEYAKANLVFDKLDRNQSNITGEPDTQALKLYLTLCIENKSSDAAIKCVRYCKDMAFSEADEFANLIETSIELTDQQKQRLYSILGKLPQS